jgi:hypothetical protein
LRAIKRRSDEFPGKPAACDACQIPDDSGSTAGNKRDYVHVVGGQLGLADMPWMASLNVHGFYEYYAQDHFQGGLFGVNIAKKF